MPDPAQAEALLDGRVRAIVLVTPNKPTGATYPAATIAAFQDLCRRRGLWLILDETYRDFRPAEAGPPHRLAAGGWPDGVVGLYSFSKAYAVPGHRLGAIAAPDALAASLLKVQDCVQICAGRPIQAAITWGLTALAPWREERRQAVARAGEAFRAAMADATGWSVASLGAYFAYLRHPYPDMPAAVVAERLARERGVLVLPGCDFGPGQERYLRLSFPGLTLAQVTELPKRLTPKASKQIIVGLANVFSYSMAATSSIPLLLFLVERDIISRGLVADENHSRVARSLGIRPLPAAGLARRAGPPGCVAGWDRSRES